MKMTDSDATAMRVNAGSITEMGHALNVAMSRDANARAAYERIYGEVWTSIPAIGGEDYFGNATEDMDADRTARASLATVI